MSVNLNISGHDCHSKYQLIRRVTCALLDARESTGFHEVARGFACGRMRHNVIISCLIPVAAIVITFTRKHILHFIDLATHSNPGSNASLDSSAEKHQSESALHPESDINPSSIHSHLERPSSRLFALLIGINQYQDVNVRDLQGAVADVDRFKEYLETDLSVPKAQIVTLLNEQATHDAILEAIKAFSRNDKIQPKDAILIYFAGHGTRAPAPDAWKDYCQHTEMLVPYDRGICNIQGIPDRVLSYYLELVAKAKGDNITVILDSCHSGSGTREGEDTEGVNRSIETIKPVQADLYPEIGGGADSSLERFESRGIKIAGTFAEYSDTSHILLAACGPGEVAREKQGHGIFTMALLETLRLHGADALSYRDIINEIRRDDLVMQNPQCEGKNRDRLVFNSRASNYASRLCRVMRQNNQYIMQAGAAHDVTEGARYLLYENRNSYNKNESLGALTSTKVMEDTTILTPERDGFLGAIIETSEFVALKVAAGADEILHIYASEDDWIFPLLRRLEEEGRNSNRLWQIKLVGKHDDTLPFIALRTIDDKTAVVEITDQQSRSYGMGPLSRNLDLGSSNENLADFLRSVAHFHHQLRRKGSLMYPLNPIKIEFSELFRSFDINEQTFRYIYSPKTENGRVINLINNGEIILEIEDYAVNKNRRSSVMTPERYGFTIRNESEKSLYVSVFYFDMSEFNIISYYQPPHAGLGQTEPCLPAGGVLSIGHGLSASPAWQYGLSENQDMDLGYLRFFVSRNPVDLSHLPQFSAFDTSRLCQEAQIPKSPMLYTMTIPVIQRRTFKSY